MLVSKQPGKLCRGFSIVELMVAMAIFSILGGMGFQAFQVFRGKSSENLSKRLVLQMEARKAIVTLYRELQEGIEVVSPTSGCTLPYLVYKDYINNVRMVYLVEDPIRTKEEGQTVFKAMTVTYDPSGISVKEPRCLMQHVIKLNFTTYSPGGCLISATLRGGHGDFSVINFVRLKNVSSQEDL
ncbi:prepilin-type N-terminal cleavage/methylation domain-containing protein [bacterium]|nr:prepilin-type N-terminal cleavage/methylation domain-containing protein [bacterium]